jgi:hypothetical protein
MNHSVLAYAHASLAMLGLKWSFERAAESDLAYVLNELYRGKAPPEAERERRRAESNQNTATYRRTLQRKTAYSLLWVAAAAAAAYWLVVMPTLPLGARPTTQQIYAAASVLFFSWGTLGRLGWNQGSFGGVTVFEGLDTIIFWLLYGLGTFFGVAAVASAA